MEYILSREEMQEIDRSTSDKIGIDAFTLMERAALETAYYIKQKFGICKVCIVAGTGNNGGDGIALARILWEFGFKPSLYIIGDMNRCSDLVLKQIDILSNYPIEYNNCIPKHDNYDVLIDGIFGIGLNRIVEGEYRDAINFINTCNCKKIALDIPSGINANTGEIMGIAVNADYTIAFGAKKKGHILYPGRSYSGEVNCVKIGIPVELFGDFSTFTFDHNDRLFALRKPDGNKGTFGKILLIAGSKTMGGACVLMAKAALHAGAGMVKVITCQENRDLILSSIPEAMVEIYDNDVTSLEKSIEWSDVVAIGPGLSTDDTANKLVRKTLEYINKPLVVDADALNIIAENKDLLEIIKTKNNHFVFTPHIGEFSRLSGKSISEIKNDFIDLCVNYSVENKIILACKDACSLVTDGNKIFLNTVGNDGMATAGSGDVLAGIIAAFLAVYDDKLIAVAKGVYAHGLAGDIAKEKTSAYYIIAEDIISQLPNIQ